MSNEVDDYQDTDCKNTSIINTDRMSFAINFYFFLAVAQLILKVLKEAKGLMKMVNNVVKGIFAVL